MQADQLSAPISEAAAGTAGGPSAPAVRGRGVDTTRLLSLQIAIGAIAGFATTVIWGDGRRRVLLARLGVVRARRSRSR